MELNSNGLRLPPPWISPAAGKPNREVPPVITVPRRQQAGSYDTDAAAWIALIEAADGQTLETAVKDAYNAFVVGCKADASLNAGVSNWAATEQVLVFRGPRTLTGALITPKGLAVTNVGFVTGDYSRKVDLKGNGVKYINANRAPSADGQNNASLWVNVNRAATTNNTKYAGCQDGAGQTTRVADNVSFFTASVNSLTIYSGPSGSAQSTGFIGVARNSSSQITVRHGGVNYNFSSTSATPLNLSYYLFSRNVSGLPNQGTDAGISAYGSGKAIDLALMGARVETLMVALAAAIP
jgi:hypothetical protein